MGKIYDPTPDEITSMREEIQVGWSEDERERRRVGVYGEGNDRRDPKHYVVLTARIHERGEPVRDQFAMM